MLRRARSFMSSARRQVTRRGSRPSALPQYRWLSTIAASRLLARGDGVEVAGEVQVDLRPSARPGPCRRRWPRPSRRSRGRATAPAGRSWLRCPSARSASPRPIVVVVLPSPAGGRADAGDQHQLARPAALAPGPAGSRKPPSPCGGHTGSGPSPGCRPARRCPRSAAGSRRARSRGRWPWHPSRQALRAYRSPAAAASRSRDPQPQPAPATLGSRRGFGPHGKPLHRRVPLR